MRGWWTRSAAISDTEIPITANEDRRDITKGETKLAVTSGKDVIEFGRS